MSRSFLVCSTIFLISCINPGLSRLSKSPIESSTIVTLHTSNLQTDSTMESDVELESRLSLCELVERRGYSCVPHRVVTSDGYILTVFRIGPSDFLQASNTNRSREPVLLMHGLLDSAATWVNNFRSQSLAYVLVDAGFDVWLGNVRGSTYSRQHLRLDPDVDRAYWDFSFDEMARHDLPATISTVLRATGKPRLSFIGHSQVCTAAHISTKHYTTVTYLYTSTLLKVFVENVIRTHNAFSALILSPKKSAVSICVHVAYSYALVQSQVYMLHT